MNELSFVIFQNTSKLHPPMLTFSIYLVATLLVITCLLLILLVLMQRPKQEGLGAAFGAGVTDQIWGSQTTNVLQKGTVFLGVLFFVLSLTLCVLEARKAKQFTGMNVPTTTITPISPATPATTTSTPFTVPPVAPAPADGTTPVAPAEGIPVPPVETPVLPVEPPTTAPAAETPAAETPAVVKETPTLKPTGTTPPPATPEPPK